MEMERAEDGKRAWGDAPGPGDLSRALVDSWPQQVELRAPLVVDALKALSCFGKQAFARNLPIFFPLLTNLIRCEAAPIEVYRSLSGVFTECVQPIVVEHVGS